MLAASWHGSGALLKMGRVRTVGEFSSVRLSSQWSLPYSILTFSLVFIEVYFAYSLEYRPHVPCLKYLYTITEYLCIYHPDPEIEPCQNPQISQVLRINIFVHCAACGHKADLLQEPKAAFLCNSE